MLSNGEGGLGWGPHKFYSTQEVSRAISPNSRPQDRSWGEYWLSGCLWTILFQVPSLVRQWITDLHIARA